jgi:hypothetical protein
LLQVRRGRERPPRASMVLNMAEDTPARLTAIERLAAIKQHGLESGLKQTMAHRWCCDRHGGCARPAFLEKPPRLAPLRFAVTSSGPAAVMPNLTAVAYDERVLQQWLCLCEVRHGLPCDSGGLLR